MRLDIINQRTRLPDRLLVTPKLDLWCKHTTMMTKKEALQEFRSCDCVVKGDRIATAENWNNYTDFLCKDRQITMKQYESWTNPF